MKSEDFKQIVNHTSFLKLATSLLKTSEDDVKIFFPFFRIDLPASFTEDNKKVSLPWHQEFGYFMKDGDCTPNSIVLSTYLHDCKKNEGALEISLDQQLEFVDHSERFVDPNQKKFSKSKIELYL